MDTSIYMSRIEVFLTKSRQWTEKGANPGINFVHAQWVVNVLSVINTSAERWTTVHEKG